MRKRRSFMMRRNKGRPRRSLAIDDMINAIVAGALVLLIGYTFIIVRDLRDKVNEQSYVWNRKIVEDYSQDLIDLLANLTLSTPGKDVEPELQKQHRSLRKYSQASPSPPYTMMAFLDSLVMGTRSYVEYRSRIDSTHRAVEWERSVRLLCYDLAVPPDDYRINVERLDVYRMNVLGVLHFLRHRDLRKDKLAARRHLSMADEYFRQAAKMDPLFSRAVSNQGVSKFYQSALEGNLKKKAQLIREYRGLSLRALSLASNSQEAAICANNIGDSFMLEALSLMGEGQQAKAKPLVDQADHYIGRAMAISNKAGYQLTGIQLKMVKSIVRDGLLRQQETVRLLDQFKLHLTREVDRWKGTSRQTLEEEPYLAAFVKYGTKETPCILEDLCRALGIP